ncbi:MULTISPECIES: DUF554 domain-containing protein [unclassified Facklamia]|uniref:DUF554 domain-containing protein n=1 Tax=Aerococcaceae TaxID=186827 RepID=UPI0013B7276D|nr:MULTISPECIES: DUF554 domain-containing protein [unclassified Facklamia]NEW64832.1 DUF554 family protein [Facklamia sp. 252]NEW68154.1 DUF554 family protein [Facklamia sp. 253]QQD64985.1 DUF554 domain-containing protein [Aerococcaceae bacterium zg-252]
MPIGVLINSLSIIAGGLFGGLFGNYLSERMKQQLVIVFGICSFAMAIPSIILMENLSAVVFAIIFGTILGVALNLEELMVKMGQWLNRMIQKVLPIQHNGLKGKTFDNELLTILVLFCASGTGLYGTLISGIEGDHSLLITKSILDFFTAAIFACNLGLVVSMIAIPQTIIFLSIFMLSHWIAPLMNPIMVNDFKSCGGILILAVAFRMLDLKRTPTAEMIPAMVLVIPISWLWQHFVLPLF